MVMVKCPAYERLHSEAENVLGNLAQVTTLLLELFRSSDWNGVHRLDKELELTVGEKERCIGALRQHLKEHNCFAQSTIGSDAVVGRTKNAVGRETKAPDGETA
jgi:putative methionine-R-sulfoxide reductase with GAF domain